MRYNKRKGGMAVDSRKKLLRNVFLGVAGCIVLYWLLNEPDRIKTWWGILWGIVAPFVVGAVVAFVLNVPMRAIEGKLTGIKKEKLRRSLAILLTVLAVVVVLTGIIWLLVPQVVHTAESLVSQLPAFFERVRVSVEQFLNANPELKEWAGENTNISNVNWASVIEELFNRFGGSVSTIVGGTISGVISLGKGLFDAVLSAVFAIYCLGRKETLASQFRRVLYAFVPERAGDEVVRIMRMSNAAFSNFISGQCLEALILGCMFAVTMTVFRMPYTPLVSVVIAVTALVPIVGAFAGCAIGAFFIMVDNPIQALWFIVIFLVLQQIEGNLIYPRVVGTSIGLPGMWVLVAVAVGGDLMGVSGMLLMIPVSSVLYALLREITGKRLKARAVDGKKLQAHPPEGHSKLAETLARYKEKRAAKKQAKEQK